jgi:hypothetical protein
MSPKPQKIESKNLKAFLDANKRKTRLTGQLERFLLAQEPEDRRQDVLHPSDLVKSEWCALHAYHALRGNYVATADKPTLRLQSIFDEGHAIHHKWQNWIYRMGNLYGVWECNYCNETVMDTSPKTCTFCGHESFQYLEVPLTSDAHKIAGSSDGWIKGLGEDYLIEIKSIGAGTLRWEAPSILAQAGGDLEVAWRAIRQPFRSHLLQGQVYLHLCHLMVEAGIAESAPESIVFIYELKSNQDYKEFEVMYDPEYILDIFENAADVAWAVDNDRPPACNIDPVKGCKRCSTFREETND